MGIFQQNGSREPKLPGEIRPISCVSLRLSAGKSTICPFICCHELANSIDSDKMQGAFKLLLMYCSSSLRSKFNKNKAPHWKKSTSSRTWLLLRVFTLLPNIAKPIPVICGPRKQIYFKLKTDVMSHIFPYSATWNWCFRTFKAPAMLHNKSGFHIQYFDTYFPTSLLFESWLPTHSSRNLWANINWIKISCILSPKLLGPRNSEDPGLKAFSGVGWPNNAKFSVVTL